MSVKDHIGSLFGDHEYGSGKLSTNDLGLNGGIDDSEALSALDGKVLVEAGSESDGASKSI